MHNAPASPQHDNAKAQQSDSSKTVPAVGNRRKQRVNPSRYRLIGPTFTSLLALVASGALNVTLTIPRCFFEAARLLQG